MPPWRNRARSSMLSAPAAMPATSEDSFSPALAPLSVGTLIRSSASLNRPGFGAASFFEKDVDHAREEVPGRAAGTGAADGDGPARGVPDALCLREGAGAEAGGRCRDVAEVDLAGAGRLR